MTKQELNKALQACTLIAGMAITAPSQAIALLTEGDGSFGELAMQKNDDGSTNALNLPFGVNFFGNTYETFHINNNGNVTFNGTVSSYTPESFPVSNQPMIAPYWGDVDTDCGSCGNVYVGAVNQETVIVTWNDVGYFPSNPTKTNNFQLVMQDKSGETGNAGDFDVQFRYDRLQWTTGNASGGSNGLGGTPAQAGYDAGDGSNYFTLPGSQTAAVLDLQDTSNVSTTTPGLWSFAIRSGALPGETPDNPLLPVTTDEGFQFDFNVDLNEQIFIDPEVAIGYDYEINSSSPANAFAAVELPDIGDGMFDLWLFDDMLGEYVDSGTDIAAGIEYMFGSTDVTRFRIMGIEVTENLDPNDPLAFVTGLRFVNAGQVSMTQSPVTTFVNNGTVPEPQVLLLLGSGLLGMVLVRRKRA